VQSALVGDRAKALADQRLVGALDDHRVVEVAVPQRRSELEAVELTPEPPTVFLVRQQLVALKLIAQMQGGGSRAELFEPAASITSGQPVSSSGPSKGLATVAATPSRCPAYGFAAGCRCRRTTIRRE
jgi:hypothetical protein